MSKDYPWLYFDTATPETILGKDRSWLTDKHVAERRIEATGHPQNFTVLVDAQLIFVYLWHTTAAADRPVIIVHESLLA